MTQNDDMRARARIRHAHVHVPKLGIAIDPQTYKQCDRLAGTTMSEKAKKKKKAKLPFDASKRKALATDLEGEDYSAVVDSVIERLLSGLHLELSEPRKAFVSAICDPDKPIRESLVACIMGMILSFIDLYRECMKGKKYANMQQQWMMNINNYLQHEESVCSEAVTSSCTDKEEQYKLWYSVFNAAKKIGYTLVEREERIVVSTLCYAVYDLMVDKVKDYKVEQMVQTEITATATASSTSGASRIKLRESNVNLYRYGGFALHSMISKRNKAKQKSPQDPALLQTELKFLHSLRIPKDRWNELPGPILDLNQGGLHIVVPEMLPFLRNLVEKVASKVNDDTRQEHGQQLIKIAKREIENDTELLKSFETCIRKSEYPKECVLRLYSEFCIKVFHARVNEYMVASEEIELEKSGKAVKAEQCLRDELKTFSALKGR